MKKRIGLVLSGGGAHGIAHTEIFKILDELDIKPSIIAGTSVGALLGAMYASGLKGEEIQNILLHLNLFDVSKFFDISLSGKGMFKGKAIMNEFSKHVNIKSFKNLHIPLIISATNLNKKKSELISKGNLPKAVHASIAIPGIFEPVKINKDFYIDGGVTNPLPVDAIKDKCDILIAVDIIQGKVMNGTSPDIFNTITASFEILQQKIINENILKKNIDHYFSFNLKDYSMLDFHKFKKMLLEVQKQAKPYKRKLRQIQL